MAGGVGREFGGFAEVVEAPYEALTRPPGLRGVGALALRFAATPGCFAG